MATHLKELRCLQCNIPAKNTNQVTNEGIQLRVCNEGHWTGEATTEMIKTSEIWKKQAKKALEEGLIDFDPNNSKAA